MCLRKAIDKHYVPAMRELAGILETSSEAGRDGKKAADLCRRALELDSSIINIWDTMGLIQMKRKNNEEAEGHLLMAVEMNPMFPDGWRHLLHVYHRLGQAEKLAKTRARVGYYLPEQLKRFEREKDSDITD